jgi:hypothetical protein
MTDSVDRGVSIAAQVQVDEVEALNHAEARAITVMLKEHERSRRLKCCVGS